MLEKMRFSETVVNIVCLLFLLQSSGTSIVGSALKSTKTGKPFGDICGTSAAKNPRFSAVFALFDLKGRRTSKPTWPRITSHLQKSTPLDLVGPQEDLRYIVGNPVPSFGVDDLRNI